MPGLRCILLGLALLPAVAWGQMFQAGEDYRVLDEPLETEVETGVEVHEFFSYACPHCNDFNPVLHEVMNDLGERAELVRTPVIFNPSWEPVARTYYTLEAIGAVDQGHDAVFAAIHDNGRRLQSLDGITDVVADAGVDAEAFREAWESFSVDSAMRSGERLARNYGVRSTPTVAVAGQYVVSVRQAGGQQAMAEIIRYLVDREHDDGQ